MTPSHSTDSPKVRRLSRPAGMTVGNVLAAIGDTVSFEYFGDTDQRFRGIATTTKAREVRRRFWVMRDQDWTRTGTDLYQDSDSTPEEDIATALELGAEGVICSPRFKGSPLLDGQNVFFTPSTADFTCRLIEAQRKLFRGRRTIAVTGSAGKTSTSAMIAHALRAINDHAKVQYTNQNRNFLHWVLAHQTRVHRFNHTVLEVSGASLSYDWDHYAVSADVSVVTSISEAHLEHHGSLEGVARDKSNLFKSPPDGAAAVVNIDAPYAYVLLARVESEGGRLVTYGESREADIRLTDYNLATGRVRANVAGLEVEYRLAAKGKHMALNSLATLATLKDLGLDWAAGIVALEEFVPPRGRGREVRVALNVDDDFILIDGSFNANPASIKAAIQNLKKFPPDVRKVAVLGDVLELGEHAEKVHFSLVPDIRAAELDSLHVIGEHFHAVASQEQNLAGEVYLWDNVDDLLRNLPNLLRKEDVVLIKGSGGTGLKKVAAAFLERARDVEGGPTETEGPS